jgi:hypothetical protein
LVRVAILRAALGALALLLLGIFLISLAVPLLAVLLLDRLLLVPLLRPLASLLPGVLLFVRHLLSFLVFPQATLGFRSILSNRAQSNKNLVWWGECGVLPDWNKK